MFYYPLSALINVVTSLLLGCYVIIRSPKSDTNRIFCLIAFSVAFWSTGYFFWQISKDAVTALFWCRILMLGAIFIPSSFFQFSVTLIGQYKKYSKNIVFAYILSSIFALLDFTPFFIKDVRPRLFFAYWPTAGIAYAPFLLMFSGFIIYGFILMYKTYKTLYGIKRNQIKYVLLGAFVGFLGGSTNYPLWYDIPIPPVGNAFVAMYVFLIAYSIIKYRLMDINLVLTRGAILFLVYLVIAGVPFLLMIVARPILTLWLHQRWFYPPLALYAVLALLAPYFYLKLQEKAEQRRMLEQRHLHQSLKAASKTTIEVQNMDKLSRIIPRYLIALYGKLNNKITHISLFLLDKGKKTYILKSSAGERKLSEKTSITTDSVLIKWFTETRNILVENSVLKEKEVEVLVYEDIDFWLNKPAMLRVPFKGIDKALRQLKELMESLKAQVILPSVYQEELLGFLVLGEKSPDAYSVSDIDTFSILANDSAMAFKAAELFEELKATQAHLIQSEKLNILGQLASSMAHEINNPLAIISGNVQLLLMKEKDEDKKKFLKKMNDQTERGYQIIHRLLNFSRLPKEETKDININEIIDETLELLNHKIVHSNIQLERNYKTIPKIRGNPTQIQEVFLNLFVNAIQAMPQGGKLDISTNRINGMIEIEVRDTGKGIAEEDIGNIFNPFFTKGKEEGTGLGLFVADQIMKLHKGSISAKSKPGEGTTFILKLPV